MKRSFPARPVALATAATLFIILPGLPVAQAAIVPAPASPAGAQSLANAMAADPGTVASASFETVPAFGTPNGVSDAPLSFFPTRGGSFAILTTGDVKLAGQPNDDDSSGADLGGGNARGNTDYDVSILKVNLNVPATANCLAFDFAFYSEEFPEYVGSEYNDAFMAEIDASTWSTAGSAITAPDNFAFDPAGAPITINSTGATSMSAADAIGTTYDGATPLLSASKPVTPGLHSLYLSIFDQGDRVLDSAVFLDNLRLLNVANPAVTCAPGARPVSQQNLLTGGAFGDRVATSPAGIAVSDGPNPSVVLPSHGGGTITSSVAAAGVPGQLSAGAMTVSTEGSPSDLDAFVKSSADIAPANLASGAVTVDGVHSECSSTGTGSVGITRIGKLVVNGQTLVDQTPAPNTVMTVPGYGTLVLNEQVGTNQGRSLTQFGSTSLTVNAVHLKLAPESPIGAGDITLAQARCGLAGPAVQFTSSGSVGPVIPTLSINDTSVNEGSGTPYALAQFQVTLSQASAQTVFVRFSASDGTATAADGDFVPSNGSTLSFQPGDPLTKTISIKVVNDKKPEPTETFSVRLTMPVNATIARGTGFATIIDDDPPAAVL